MDAVARLHRTTEGITMFTTNIARTTLRMVVGISLVGLTLGLNSEGFAQTRSTQFRSTRLQVAQLMNNWCVPKQNCNGCCHRAARCDSRPFVFWVVYRCSAVVKRLHLDPGARSYNSWNRSAREGRVPRPAERCQRPHSGSRWPSIHAAVLWND